MVGSIGGVDHDPSLHSPGLFPSPPPHHKLHGTMSDCVICKCTEVPMTWWACLGCLSRVDDNLSEQVEYWPLVEAAVEPSTQPTERITGTREHGLLGGEALNLIADGNAHTREQLRVAYRTAGAVRVSRDRREPCTATFEDSRCFGDKQWLGHIHRHRDERTGVSWPYQQREWKREPVTDDDGTVKLVPLGDQHGPVNPAETLWLWTRDWLTYRRAGEIGPNPDLRSIVRWLRDRLDWAGQHHPAVDDFAAEVWDITRAIRSVLNVQRYVQRYKEPCPRLGCDEVALFREVDPKRGASAWVQCGACGNLWRESEFSRLGVILEGEARRV